SSLSLMSLQRIPTGLLFPYTRSSDLLRPLIEISFPDRRLSDGGDACSSQARLIVVGFKIRLKRCPTSRQLPVQHKSLYIKGPSGSFIGQKAGLPVLRNLCRAGAVAGAVGRGRSVI